TRAGARPASRRASRPRAPGPGCSRAAEPAGAARAPPSGCRTVGSLVFDEVCDTDRIPLPVSAFHRIGYPLRLVGVRLAAGGSRLVLVAIGVVAGAAVLAAVLAGRLVMQDRSLAQATARLAPGDREIAVAWSGAENAFP